MCMFNATRNRILAHKAISLYSKSVKIIALEMLKELEELQGAGLLSSPITPEDFHNLRLSFDVFNLYAVDDIILRFGPPKKKHIILATSPESRAYMARAIAKNAVIDAETLLMSAFYNRL